MSSIDGNVMLEPILTDIAHQPLEGRDFNHPVTSEALRAVGGDFPFADVSAHIPVQVVGGYTAKSQRPAFEVADDGPERVVFANRAGDDFLKIHFERIVEE